MCYMTIVDAIKSGQILSEMSFNEKVWSVTVKVPKGKVSTYSEIARYMDCKAYRAVGQALSRNPFAPDIPCHRIVSSDGSLTGYSSDSGLEEKEQLLVGEGVTVQRGKVDLNKYMFRISQPALKPLV